MTLPTDERTPSGGLPKPLMGLGFWALIALCVLCVLAGAGVAFLAPRLAPAKPEPPAVRAAPGPPMLPAAAAATPSPAVTIPLARANDPEVARLDARIADLEGQGTRASRAATAALAASSIIEASQGSRPFAGELAGLRALAPDLDELVGLERLAQAGAPSRVALAMSFPEFAARAVRRARKPAEHAPLSERIAYGAARFVTLRQLDAPSGPDADISAAEKALQDGDVARALTRLQRLPPAAQEALAPWRQGAERRAEIDGAVAALRARAQRDLQPKRPST